MELATTYRGLSAMEAGISDRALQRVAQRLERLLDGPTTLRVVVDAAEPEYRVTLLMTMRGQDLTSEDRGHTLPNVIANAAERLRVQLVRMRHRHESQRHSTLRGKPVGATV